MSLCSRWFWTVFMWRLPPISRSCSGRNSNSQQKITEQFWEIIFWFEYLDHFEILEKCPKIPRKSVAIEISIQKFSCICTHFVNNILCVVINSWNNHHYNLSSYHALYCTGLKHLLEVGNILQYLFGRCLDNQEKVVVYDDEDVDLHIIGPVCLSVCL